MVGKKEYSVEVIARNEGTITFKVDGKEYETQLLRKPQSKQKRRAPSLGSNSPELRSPMPGIVSQVLVKKGDAIKKGDTLFVIEAMKMENNISATAAGTVQEVLVSQGAEVKADQILAKIDLA